MWETMRYRVIEDVGLVVHPEGPPSVTDCNEMLKAMGDDIRSSRIKAVRGREIGRALHALGEVRGALDPAAACSGSASDRNLLKC